MDGSGEPVHISCNIAKEGRAGEKSSRALCERKMLQLLGKREFVVAQ